MDNTDDLLKCLTAARDYYAEMAKSLSSREIAKQIGHSHAAVAYALRGKFVGGGVGDALAKWWVENSHRFHLPPKRITFGKENT